MVPAWPVNLVWNSACTIPPRRDQPEDSTAWGQVEVYVQDETMPVSVTLCLALDTPEGQALRWGQVRAHCRHGLGPSWPLDEDSPLMSSLCKEAALRDDSNL